MCGLIGYAGNEEAAPILAGALARLEYRGYDSAGIATVNGRISVAKDKGKLAEVMHSFDLLLLQGKTGVGHVRWATHGGVTKQNAHPHCDANQQIAVVHNGIIHNYREIRTRLSSRYQFLSETDTEVIPHLIRYYLDTGLSFENAFFAAIQELKGSFAILAVSVDNPDTILAARKESPLVIGIGSNANYIGSDVLSFLPHTRKIVDLGEGDFVVLTKDNVKIYNEQHQEITRTPKYVDLHWKETNRGDYEYFMLKEIEEQPYAIQQAVNQDNTLLTQMAKEISEARQVVFVACGTSRHAALIGRYAFSKMGRVFSDVVMGSEFGYFSDSVDSGTLVIAISQSGETADVLDGVRQAKANGATVFSLVNVVGSSLARESDQTIFLNCGPEIGVAATKSFAAQLCILYQLAFAMDNRLLEGQNKLREVANLVKSDISYFATCVPGIAYKLRTKHDFYYLARGVDFAVAAEGALKLKEIAYVHAEGMPSGELKHGTLAMIEEGTPVVAVCPSDYTFEDSITNIMEAKARGAHIIGISDSEHAYFDDYIHISQTDEILYPIMATIPLQFLAYYSAIVRGFDPDKPRNLAKSVTVK